MATRSQSRDPYQDRPGRCTLPPDGPVMLSYTQASGFGDDHSWAEAVWRPPGTSPERVAALVGERLAGWQLTTTDGPLARALVADGATVRRRAWRLARDLAEPPHVEMPAGQQLESLTPPQLERHALALGVLRARAYPRDHPDADDRDEAAQASLLRAIARGEVLGPLLAESTVAVGDGGISGACLAVDRVDDDPGPPGPWVLDLFRDPGAPAGLGAALLAATLTGLAEAGAAEVSLQVTDTNTPARRCYDAMGFQPADEIWTLVIDPRSPP